MPRRLANFGWLMLGFRVNWLRVFRRADAARIGQGLWQQRHTKAMQSEKCVVFRRRRWDGNASDRHVFWPACS